MKHYHEKVVASELLNSNHANMLLVRLAHWKVEKEVAIIVRIAAFLMTVLCISHCVNLKNKVPQQERCSIAMKKCDIHDVLQHCALVGLAHWKVDTAIHCPYCCSFLKWFISIKSWMGTNCHCVNLQNGGGGGGGDLSVGIPRGCCAFVLAGDTVDG